jgi:hypothetical protein
LSFEEVQEVEQVVGILVGNVEAHCEVDGAEFGNDLFQTGAQLGVAVGGFDELKLADGRLQIVAQEGGVVPVARGVDTDTDADEVRIGQRLRSESVVKHGSLQKGCERKWSREVPSEEPGHEEACDERSSLKM